MDLTSSVPDADFFRLIAENAADWVAWIDQNGRLAWTSPSCERITGYMPDELLAMNDFPAQLIRPESRSVVLASFQAALAGQPGNDVEFPLQRKDGALRWVSASWQPVDDTQKVDRGPHGALRGCRFSMRDITARKAIESDLQAERDFASSLIQTAPVIILVLDRNGCIASYNPFLEELSGWPLAEMQGRDWAEAFLPPERRADFTSLINASGATPAFARPGPEGGLTCPIRTRRGGERMIEWHHRPLAGQGILCIGLDISERRRAEEELKVYQTQLEELIEQRTLELLQRNRELEQQIEYRLQTEKAERDQRTLAAALADTTIAITSTLNLDEVLDRILSNLVQVVPYDAADVRLVDEDQQGATVVRHAGHERFGPKSRAPHYFLFTTTPTQRFMYETAAPLLIDDVTRYPAWLTLPGLEWMRAYIGAPLVYRDRVLGFVNLFSAAPGFFESGHVERLQLFANQASIAIRNARLYERARELATWEERQRLAREMHDAVSQTLFSASVMAETLPRLAKKSPQRVAEGLVDLQRLTRGALAEMRTLLLELRPAALTNASLGDLLRQLADAVAGRKQIEVTTTIVDLRPLPPAVQTAFFRIAQEALNNIIKHASARRIQLTLENHAGRTWLQVCDDGRGFDPEATHPGRLGLAIMRERAESIGARFSLATRPGEGTIIEVELCYNHGYEKR